jgi:hypothetical protein
MNKNKYLPLPKSNNPLTEALRQYNGFYSEQAKAEHAALEAVAEAAEYACCGSPCNHNRCQGINSALANLAAVREGRQGEK